MKKLFAFLSCLVIVLLCILVPVSASSPISFDPIYLNSNPVALCFSSISYPGDFFVSSDVWSDYLENADGDDKLALYVMCLDSRMSIVDSVSVSIGLYDNQQLVSTIVNYNDNLNLFEYNLGYYSHSEFIRYDLQFFVSDSRVQYLSIIVVRPDEDAYSADIYELNYKFGTTFGYSAGYDDGYRQGQTDSQGDQQQIGYNRGYWVGYQDGLDANPTDDDFHAISDATLQVVSAPFQAISNALNFSVFGVNIASLFAIIVTLLIIGFILKHFI